MSFYQWKDDDLLLFVRTQPNASSDALAELIEQENLPDQIKIRITAPAVDGKANKHLVNYLSKLFKVSRSQVEILSGLTSRNKKILVKEPKQLPEQISH